MLMLVNVPKVFSVEAVMEAEEVLGGADERGYEYVGFDSRDGSG